MGMRDRDDTNLPAVRNSPADMSVAIKNFDFSPAAQRRAVREVALFGTMTSYPMIAGVFGFIGVVLLDPVLFAISMIVGFGGLIVGFGNIFYTFRHRGREIAHTYLQSLNQMIVDQRDAKLQTIERELEDCGAHVNGCNRVAQQGSAQFRKGKEKLENFYLILGKKLSSTELMALRFSGTAEQLYLCVLDNLRQMTILLQSVSTIDERELNTRLDAFERMAERSLLDEREMQALKEEKHLRESKLEEVATLLTENEEALADLDAFAVTVADMKTDSREAAMRMEDARNELAETVRRIGARFSTRAAAITIEE